VTIDDPKLDRITEISDSEVTVEQFLQFRPGYEYEVMASPSSDCPINSVDYSTAGAFCNWLSELENIPTGQQCYVPRRDRPGDFASDRSYRDRPGYRLLDEVEFVVSSQAGTVTRRYFGDSDRLLALYAWYQANSESVSHPVCHLKPNDSGLFDALGNVREWCEAEQWSESPRLQRLAGAGFPARPQSLDATVDDFAVASAVQGSIFHDGFRVARTVGLRK